MTGHQTSLPRAAVDAKLVRLIATGAIGLGVLLSGFVLHEPAPYELYMAGLMALWFLFGLKIDRGTAPLLVLVIFFNIGGMVAATQMADLHTAPLYLAVSIFLGLSSVFFAAATSARPTLFETIVLAWLLAGLMTAALGIIGYFELVPGAGIFTRHGRASGAFEDPNVFGPFLVLPAIYLLHRLIYGTLAELPLHGGLLALVTCAIFLSFSRGAWSLYVVAATFLVATVAIHNGNGLFRLRIAVLSLLAIALAAAAVLIVLQMGDVADMLAQRARLMQAYDEGRLGRFARFTIGLAMALENPLGIGPLMFGRMLGEDTHNIWLKALLDHGWIGFAAYVILITWTLAAGFKILFRLRPWQPYFSCAYVVLVGHVALGMVIDTDHWRHFYLLLGLVWGGIALERRERRGMAPRT